MKPTLFQIFFAVMVTLLHGTIQISDGMGLPPSPGAWRTDSDKAQVICAKGGFYRGVDDGNKYFKCKRWEGGYYLPSPRDCLPGLAFNLITNICDLPENVPGWSITDPSSAPAPAPATPAHEESTIKGYATPVFSRDRTDCRKYYKDCASPEGCIPFSCDLGYAFNLFTGKCDWPENVEECK